MAAVQYDPKIIQTLAEGLYARARSIERTSAFVGAVLGVGSGGAVGVAIGESGVAAGMALVGLLLGGYIGYTVGRSRAFVLRVQAQTALCQKQIELNTRRRVDGGLEQP